MNKNMDNSADQQGIKKESRAWLTYLYSGELEPDKLEAFKRWLNASEDHRQAFTASERVWQSVGLTNSALDWVTEVSAQKTVVYIDNAQNNIENNTEEKLKGNKQSKTKSLKETQAPWGLYCYQGLAASVIAGLVLVGLLLSTLFLSTDKREPAIRYASDVAQNLEVVLSDGSKVTLAGDSAILVNITVHQRNVVLQQGSAYFDVIPDNSRLFSVTARRTQVRVKGTAFEVKHGSDQVRISVTQGSVEVASLAPIKQPHEAIEAQKRDLTTLQLVENEQITADSDGDFIGSKTQFDKNNALAWLDGRLIFDSAPLKEVIAEVNRYYPKTIVIADTEINDLLITTSFQFKQIDQMLSGLPAAYPVVVKQSQDQIVIAAKKAK